MYCKKCGSQIKENQRFCPNCGAEQKSQDIYRIYRLDHTIEIDPYLRRWKSNAQGIDINRNFDALWDQYNDHLGHPSPDHYKGEKPECTAEAEVFRQTWHRSQRYTRKAEMFLQKLCTICRWRASKSRRLDMKIMELSHGIMVAASFFCFRLSLMVPFRNFSVQLQKMAGNGIIHAKERRRE